MRDLVDERRHARRKRQEQKLLAKLLFDDVQRGWISAPLIGLRAQDTSQRSLSGMEYHESIPSTEDAPISLSSCSATVHLWEENQNMFSDRRLMTGMVTSEAMIDT
jgi:hypothetical protein